MIKLIATDMDGTLLKSNGEFPNEFPFILNSLLNKNIMFSVASGRQYFTLRDNMDAFKDKITFIAENGAFIVKNGEELFAKTLDRNIVAKVIDDVHKIPDCKLVLCGKRSAYTLDNSSEFVGEVEKYYHKNTVVDSLDDIDDEFFKIAVCDYKGSENHSNLILTPKWGETLQCTVSGEVWLDLGRKDVNKGTAIKFLQDKFNIKENETMAFGDYYNDVSMLESVYHSYVMENAPDEMKKHGRFLAKSNDESGVIHVIKDKILKLDA
ncbi:Cof-type HAD-IIB family hydrolase [Clostridium felsineum]|uniref:5-amino-6-(5-phospho-D-ribitylamino)uracil phosphatase YbjI n=1 Tax=Clostridium felsineum TaxID=36839 RepID=A0A1S8LF82_9CLOT|nr:Cof-type HAD-IIB family hydrolase [Clostridium felsineum]MCR3760523.1 Cof-type HAD-IIB family hydrolase [Clostridium felsineum]URZ02092.1 5-amino-6-(5-phospho-D-ribitylamino)uracil phosphatase YbjI [Clostridium felsineum]URZ05139.1 5-amino-6-(5-phospho-D-ribitylamino)uracil phosphatase YbjI [Clostridium felsineum]URZ10180.1 5-amino-6-(5-phospho-D-ribitylamino)uracil phosphatase YbjI [Clostridium felsineum]URZ17925.1 5-amino-6-(5-phospho-D-ribitylamino)uracil phosphatase YbjI [Clostridium fe